MKKRIKRLFTLIIALALVNQLPGVSEIISLAADITVSSAVSISEDSADNYIYESGATGVSLTVDSGVTVSGNVTLASSGSILNNSGSITGTVTVSGDGSTVNNYGSISNVISNTASVTFIGGSFGSVQIASGSVVQDCTIGDFNAEGEAVISGTVNATDASVGVFSGSGTVNVSSSLTVTGTGSTATINVNAQTNLSITGGDVTVYCDGVAYNVEAGYEGTLFDIYGRTVSFITVDEAGNTVSDEVTKATCLAGGTTGVIENEAADGYYFPDSFETEVATDGLGTVNVFRISDTIVQLSYTATSNDNQEITVTMPDSAKILPAGSGSLNVPDTYYGVKPSASFSSATNSTAGAKVEYKVAGTADSTYTTTAPTAVGIYVARVVLPGNENYAELILTDEFTIDYLDTPENPYYFSGESGDNDFYTTSVTVIAKQGYLISESLDGEYVSQFTVNSSKASAIVYFMEEATGAKTAGIIMPNINIDTVVPVVDAKENNTYYGESLAVAVSDDNLQSITVNGEKVDFEGESTVLNLKSNGGVEEYEITVTDFAGHTRTISFTLASEWTKTGIIPGGMQVKLAANNPYKLGDGNWTVSGDSTSYNGNTTFYVGEENSYTFIQQ